MSYKVKAAVAFAPNQALEMREVDLADPGAGEVAILSAEQGVPLPGV